MRVETKNKVGHAMLVAAYWFVLLGIAGEFSTTTGQTNRDLPWFFLGWIAFGVWRVVKKYRHGRHEAGTP